MNSVDRVLARTETKQVPSVVSAIVDEVDEVDKVDEVYEADDRPHFFAVTFWAVLLGPLIGGAPYNWLLLPIPFAYMLGGLPALLGGAMFAAWLRAGPLPGAWHGALFGALFGAIGGVIGCAISGIVALLWQEQTPNVGAALFAIQQYAESSVHGEILFVLPHAIVAGAVLGGLMVRRMHKNKLAKTFSGGKK
jgi:hypothetical protein